MLVIVLDIILLGLAVHFINHNSLKIISIMLILVSVIYSVPDCMQNYRWSSFWTYLDYQNIFDDPKHLNVTNGANTFSRDVSWRSTFKVRDDSTLWIQIKKYEKHQRSEQRYKQEWHISVLWSSTESIKLRVEATAYLTDSCRASVVLQKIQPAKKPPPKKQHLKADLFSRLEVIWVPTNHLVI